MNREENKEKEKTELEIDVKNFGPVSEGRITLKPFTVFIGPNNSGKSYITMLFHSIFESYIPASLRGYSGNMDLLFLRGRYYVEKIDSSNFDKEFPELRKQLEDLKEGEELKVPKKIIEKITNKIFEEIYEKKLNDEIIGSFACPLNELIRNGKDTFELKININSSVADLACQKDKLKIKSYPQLDLNIQIKKNPRRNGFSYTKNGKDVLIEIGRMRRLIRTKEIKEENEISFFRVMDAIMDVCASDILENNVMFCHYLPAARSGILQGHKVLTAIMWKKIPYIGTEKWDIPKFSGVVSDFISSVTTLPDKKGFFFKLANDFSNELIKGEIILRTIAEHPYPEIKYNFQNTEIPLHRSSSTVSELAPLFLYLKYIVKPEDILIIEEPEAHLHPANQRILAKYLVRLIRKGVRLIITTHSEYLLEQLNNFILLSKIESKNRIERYNYNEEDFLNRDEIAAYLFKYDIESGGHKIDEVEMTDDGISQDEFIKVKENLYEETIKLHRELDQDV